MNNWLKDFWIVGSKGGETQRGRLPVDDPEGITGQYDKEGNLITTGAISTALTEVIDLVSEGEIQGPATGFWIYSGNLFETGYRTGTFSGYDVPPGTTNSRWMRSVFWNETPLVDSNNRFNFPNINVKWTEGTENGEVLNESSSDLTVTKIYNERLRSAYTNPNDGTLVGNNSDYAKIYRILNPACIGVKVNIKFGQLYKRNVTEEEYGDVEQTTVIYQIEYRGLFADGSDDGWSVPYKEIVKGKISYGYIKSSQVNFNGVNIIGRNPPSQINTTDKSANINRKDFLGWEIRITRLTPDSTSSLVVDQTYIDSITELYGDKYLYPNSAMFKNVFNAEYFAQIPQRSYDINLIKVKIPSNYNPILHSYSGEWDGTFATEKQWTDNPAWCFYDLITNKRYGLGKYINEAAVDKWTLYKAAQYCDVLVPDGFGKLEPRFTCNTIINSREDAFKVINDMASIFRSIAYYSNGSLNIMQDSKADLNSEVFQIFTNANVEDGNFNYTTSPQSSRSSVAIIRYNDKNNFYKPAIEYVEDIDAIKRYGYREKELTAYGCTSRGQAIRYGKWALLTENYQYESINFAGGPECALLSPGSVIKVYDKNRNYTVRLGGRARFVSGTTIDLDDNIRNYIATGNLTGQQYKISLVTPTYNYNLTGIVTGSSLIPDINKSHVQTQIFTGIRATGLVSGYTRIQLPSSWDFTNYSQIKNPVWIIENATGNSAFEYIPEYWRVLNIEEERNNKYNIFGIKYYDDKYNAIDSGLATITYDYVDGEPSCPIANSLSLSGITNNEYSRIIKYEWMMPNLTNVDGYQISINGGNINEINTTRTPNILTGSKEIDVEGSYTFTVRAINKNNAVSSCSVSATTGLYDLISAIDGIVPGRLGLGYLSGIEPSKIHSTSDIDKGTITNQTDFDPIFNWDYADIKGRYDGSEQLYWRVSIRRSSSTNLPDPIYYYQETGLTFPDGIISYDGFTFAKNMSISLPPAIAGKVETPPYRSYDLVVEAHDAQGNSSAGGNFNQNMNTSGLRDSTWSNGIGWDIINVYNPPITGLFLWTGNRIGGGYATAENYIDSFNSGSFHIDAYITTNQSIGLNIITGKYNPLDISSYFVYFSGNNNRFTTGAAFSGLVNYSEQFDSTQFTEYPIYLELNPPLNSIDASTKSGYLCLSIADTFDVAKFDNTIGGFDYRTGLQFSNVVPIFLRGGGGEGTISTSASSGSASALPGAPAGYLSTLIADKFGITGLRKIPYYN